MVYSVIIAITLHQLHTHTSPTSPQPHHNRRCGRDWLYLYMVYWL